MDYFLRIQKSIDYIEDNLTEEINLEDISSQAYCSVPHFYRIFQITTGYSVMDYVRKRRLSQAAYELLTTNKRIIDVAFNYQFSSEESFIRSFSKLFGTTPGRYRKSNNVHDLFTKITLDNYNIILKKGDVDMEPRFIRKDFKLIGVEGEINFNGNFVKTITLLNERLFNKFSSITNLVNPSSFIAHWYYKSNNNNEEPVCYYFASVEVRDLENIPEGLISKIIPESNYAIFDEKKRGEIAGPNGYAYKIWLPTSGKELNQAIPGDFEFYTDRHNIGPNSPCKIYIPIK